MKPEPATETEALVTEYLLAFRGLLDVHFLDAMDRTVRILAEARNRGATIYIAGNGGSAATASHWANDLGKGAKHFAAEPMRVMSLNDNVSWMTALANDEGYNRIFAGQLENFARPGDVLIVISASGNSPNLLEAVALARSRQVTTIALLGFDGGVLKNQVDEYLWLPTEKGAYGIAEAAHSTVCHILSTGLGRLASLEDGHEHVDGFQ